MQPDAAAPSVSVVIFGLQLKIRSGDKNRMKFSVGNADQAPPTCLNSNSLASVLPYKPALCNLDRITAETSKQIIPKKDQNKPTQS